MTFSGQGFHVLQHFLNMAGDLDSSPFPPQYSLRINYERAAVDATDLLAVHVFHLHDVEQLASRFVSIAQQFERETHLHLEIFMRFDAVSRDTYNIAVEFGEFRVSITELLALGSATGRVVLGIKINYQIFSVGCG